MRDRDALNRKDLESDMAVYAACTSQGSDCQSERAKAKAAQDTYFNQTYQNPKEAQAGYQQIQNLLNSTDPNAKEVFNVLEGYTQAFMTFGYTEEESRTRAGAYVGSMYIAGGVSAVVASGAQTKQFGKDVAPGTKSGNSTVKPIENEPNSSETGGAVGIGKTAAEATAAKAEAAAANAAKNAGNSSTINSIKNTAETQVSVDQKLANYLLDKKHPVGGSKAEWFDSSLGFNKTNSNELAKQIVFDSGKAIKTAETQFGTKYDQVIPITGTNGRTINVKFGWIENNDGVVRLVTAIPAKK